MNHPRLPFPALEAVPQFDDFDRIGRPDTFWVVVGMKHP